MEVLTVLLVAAIAFGTIDGKVTPRISGGIPVDTLSKFSHHVTIHTQTDSGESWFCSGSVITDQWILTSLGCVSGGTQFRLDFNRMFLNSSRGSFAAIVDDSGLVIYPTGYDDVALLKMPMKLVLSSKVQTIPFREFDGGYGNNFAVMPGFSTEDESDKLTYGMFQIVAKGRCESAYGSEFDPYNELCSVGWNNNRNVPCKGNQGGGLIYGWPRKPELIGIFSRPQNCSAANPAVYIEVSKYAPWIRSIIGEGDIPV